MDTGEAISGENSDTEIEIEPIDIHICHGKIFVWNAHGKLVDFSFKFELLKRC